MFWCECKYIYICLYTVLYKNHVCRKMNILNIKKKQCLPNIINKRNTGVKFGKHYTYIFCSVLLIQNLNNKESNVSCPNQFFPFPLIHALLCYFRMKNKNAKVAPSTYISVREKKTYRSLSFFSTRNFQGCFLSMTIISYPLWIGVVVCKPPILSLLSLF